MQYNTGELIAILTLAVAAISALSSYLHDKESIESLRLAKETKKYDIASVNVSASSANVEAAMLLIDPLKERIEALEKEVSAWRTLYDECIKNKHQISE